MSDQQPRDLSLPKDYSIPDKYWSPPGGMNGRIGDADSAALYQAVGQALTAWGTVEEWLASLFWTLATGEGSRPRQSPIMMTWGAIESVTPRVEITRTMARSFKRKFPTVVDKDKKLNNLMDHLKKASWIRNDIAHGIVIGYAILPPQDQIPEGPLTLEYLMNEPIIKEKYCLKSPFFMTGRNDYFSDQSIISDSLNFYTSGDIYTFSYKFLILRTAIITYLGELHDRLEKLPKL